MCKFLQKSYNVGGNPLHKEAIPSFLVILTIASWKWVNKVWFLFQVFLIEKTSESTLQARLEEEV